MSSRSIRAVLGAVAVAGVFALAPSASSADCAGPSITVTPASGEPGASITITGQAFGTDCYDTGPPPPGQGVLGLPQTDIEVGFVDGAGVRTVLGTVDADDDYAFTLDSAVPAGAASGAASIRADAVGSYAVAFEVLGDPVVVPATPPFTG